MLRLLKLLVYQRLYLNRFVPICPKIPINVTRGWNFWWTWCISDLCLFRKLGRPRILFSSVNSGVARAKKTTSEPSGRAVAINTYPMGSIFSKANFWQGSFLFFHPSEANSDKRLCWNLCLIFALFTSSIAFSWFSMCPSNIQWWWWLSAYSIAIAWVIPLSACRGRWPKPKLSCQLHCLDATVCAPPIISRTVKSSCRSARPAQGTSKPWFSHGNVKGLHMCGHSCPRWRMRKLM